ncbi:MAG TPA: hypothetical protein VF089_05625 [Candidatus Binatia bacterium]
MANTITIPVDAYLVTLQIESYQVVEKKIAVGKSTQIHHERVKETRDIPSNQSDKTVMRAIDVANTIWAPADITFQLRKSFSPITEAPGNAEEVSVSGFFQMITTLKIKPIGAVAALFVNRFEKRDLGGFAAEALGVCIVTSLGDPVLGKTLAHEFGHLLSLPDLRNDPKSVANNYNLMYEASRAGDKLTSDQISKARNSERVKLVYQSA